MHSFLISTFKKKKSEAEAEVEVEEDEKDEKQKHIAPAETEYEKNQRKGRGHTLVLDMQRRHTRTFIRLHSTIHHSRPPKPRICIRNQRDGWPDAGDHARILDHLWQRDQCQVGLAEF